MADFKIGLDFSDDRLIEVLEKAFGAADRLDKKVDQLQAQLNKGFPTGKAQSLTAEIDKAAKGGKEGASNMAQFGASAGLAYAKFQLAFAAAQKVYSTLIASPVAFAAAAETAEANFTTFLGSASAAKSVLADINKFAADTPFTQGQITNVAQSLIAFGVEADKLKPTLQTLGDLSGGNAEKFGDLARIFGQAKTTTKVFTEDLNQLAERGIPVLQELAKQNNTTEAAIRKLASEGKIGFGDLEKAFAGLTSEGGKFYGLMARQSQTFEGLRSTLQGNFEQLQASIGQILLPTLKQLVISINEVISAVDTSNFKDIGFDILFSFEQLGAKFKPIIDAIRSGFSEQILPALRTFGATVEDVFVRVSGAFSSLTEGGQAVNYLKSLINFLSTAFARLVDEISFVIGATADLVGPVVSALIPALKSVYSAITAVLDSFSSLGSALPATGGAFQFFGQILGKLASAVGYLVQLFAEGVKGIVGVKDAMKSADPFIRGFGELIDFLAAPWRALASGIGSVISELGIFFGLTKSQEEATRDAFEAERDGRTENLSAARDAYEKEADLRNENNIGVQKALDEKRKIQADANAKSQAEKDKAAKIAQKLEEDRAALQLALITDETQRQILAENARFEAQKKQTNTLFKGRAELDGLLEKAKIIHEKNLLGISEKSAADQAKILEEQAKLRLSLFQGDAGKAEAEEFRRNKAATAAENARFQEEIANLTAHNEDKAVLDKNIESATKEHQKNIEDAEREHQKELRRIQVSTGSEAVSKATSVEDTRFNDQVKALRETFAGRQELNGLIEEAERQHEANLDKIQFDAAAKRIADDAGTRKSLGEAQIKLLEETQERYILELKNGGAGEEEIARAKAAFQLASQKLRLENEIAYQKEVLKTVAVGNEDQRKEIEAQIAILQAQLGNVNFQINAPDNLGEGLLGKLKNLKKSISEALNIPPGEFDKLVGGAVGAVGNAFKAITAVTDAQIAQNQAVIKSLDERIAKQQEAVDKEAQASQEGYANDLSIEQQRLDALLKQRDDAETKGRQLREKALRLQLLQDTAQQVSNTAVSVTNIIKNTSSIPFVGILLAAIQIGSLFALLAASRQKAKAEAASTKFFRGGKIPMFRTDEGGFEGNRIEGTNLQVGGNEFVVNRKVTAEHEPFIERLNAGEYAGRDLEKEVGESKPGAGRDGRAGAAGRDGQEASRGKAGRSADRPEAAQLHKFVQLGERDHFVTDRSAERDHFVTDRSAERDHFVTDRSAERDHFVTDRSAERDHFVTERSAERDHFVTERRDFERWASERFTESVRAFERDHFVTDRSAERDHFVTDRSRTDSRVFDSRMTETRQNSVSQIARDTILSQVVERIASQPMSPAQRVIFEQLGIGVPVHEPGTFNVLASTALPAFMSNVSDRAQKAAESVRKISRDSRDSRDDQSAKIVAAVAQQTNDLIRRGLLPLMQLGHRIVDAEGNTVHYSTDASGSTRTSKTTA